MASANRCRPRHERSAGRYARPGWEAQGVLWELRGEAALRTDAEPFRLATLAWAAVHGTVCLRIDRPNFPWPPLDEMVDDLIQRIIGLPGVS